MVKNFKAWGRYISVSELVFDFIIVVFTAFILSLINPEGKKLIETLSPVGIFFLGLGINFLVMLFMGGIYRQYEEAFDSSSVRALMKIVFFLGVTGAYLVLILFFSAYHVMPWGGIAREMDMIIVLIPVYPLFWGLVCGFGVEDMKEVRYVLYVPMTMAIPMIPITAALIGYHVRWYYGLASLPLLVLALIFPYLVVLFLERRSDERLMIRRKALKEKNRDPVALAEALYREESAVSNVRLYSKTLWEDLLLPAGAALAMLFWQQMTMEMLARAYQNWSLPPDTDFIFWSLILSGIIPLRVLSQLAPPYRPLNIVLSAVSLAYYILSLYRYLH